METIRDRLRREAGIVAARASALDRACSPSETVARLWPRHAEFGITRLAELTRLDRIGIPVWGSIRPNARTLAVCQGKGISDAAAKASALMEAVEIATAERDDLPRRRATPRALAAAGRTADLLPGLVRRGRAVPGLDEPIDWIEGHELMTGALVLLPLEAVRLDGTLREPLYWQNSDGLASGNLLIEAVVHGLCERIERDAMVLWRLRPEPQVIQACVDPGRFGDVALLELAEAVAAAGLQLRLFDMTSDIGVPACFATVSPMPDGHEADWTHFDVASGYGCHPRPARAAKRAVTEAVQSRLTVISGARDDFRPETYGARLSAEIVTYLRCVPRVDSALPPDHAGGPEGFLPAMLERLAAAGIDRVLAVPLHDDADFAVCKMIVPGLEHPPGERRQSFGSRGLAAMLRAA